MYEAHYGLNAKPFQLTPDPEFFFASTLHKRAMSYLEYGLSQAEGFIVITGGIGTGKTTIANSLLANLQGDIVALDQAQAMHHLADNAFNFSVLGNEGFATLCDVVEQAQCLQIHYSDVNDVQAFLEQDILAHE